MSMRIPRGYGVHRTYYQEICEGVRPNAQALPLTAWTGLPCIEVDEYHNDPIVIPAGTIVGLSNSSSFRNIAFPATSSTVGITYTAYTSQDERWGLPASTIATHQAGNTLKPIGVCYKPVYSHMLQTQFTNYKRSFDVGVVTDYVIQVPCVWSGEYAIEPGDLVTVTSGVSYGPSLNFHTCPAGRYAKFDATSASHTHAVVGIAGLTGTASAATVEFAQSEFIIGRCLNVIEFGTTSSTAGTTLSASLAAGTFTLSTAGANEWKGLDKVQTVPGLGLSGSGTKGVPGWLLGARSNVTTYRAMTILVRL
jgi:hypothetical protein